MRLAAALLAGLLQGCASNAECPAGMNAVAPFTDASTGNQIGVVCQGPVEKRE